MYRCYYYRRRRSRIKKSYSFEQYNTCNNNNNIFIRRTYIYILYICMYVRVDGFTGTIFYYIIILHIGIRPWQRILNANPTIIRFFFLFVAITVSLLTPSPTAASSAWTADVKVITACVWTIDSN
jgi:hypothetical protein